ncbi:MAG: segregation/condensation protein A [Deltaproteobacteria bacterium]|nr:segregation/condensation protein A [Deltaproteobacteria bacterium]
MTVSMPPGDPGLPLDTATMAYGAPYAVKLSVFEGPLDLLLHLIRQNEVEITDIPVAAISAQYLSYLDVMSELNLDVVGDYLVMAATLAWIKSRMLLPPETSGDDGEEIDPRAELVARLLEYQRFKEASEKLGDRQLLGRDVYDAYAPHVGDVPEGEREIEVGLFELVKAFKNAFEAAKATPKIHEIEAEHITVHERMVAVMESLEHVDALEFEQVFARADNGLPSRAMLVTTFLAILELTRLAVLRIFQSLNEDSVPKGPIHLRRTRQPGESDWRELISDVM